MNEKRKQPREFPRRATAMLRSRLDQKSFRLLDESEGGIGLFGGEVGMLAVGQAVEVTLSDGTSKHGVITHLRTHERGGFHVGISWK